MHHRPFSALNGVHDDIRLYSDSSDRVFIVNANIPFKGSGEKSLKNLLDDTAGNIGNSYITYALLRLLKPFSLGVINNVYSFNGWDCSDLISKINSEYDYVVINLQDQIRLSESYSYKLPCEQLISFLKKIKLPILLPSIGANYHEKIEPTDFVKLLDPDKITFVKALLDLVSLSGVRGYWTRSVFETITRESRCVAIGCPTYFETQYKLNSSMLTQIEDKDVFFTSPMPVSRYIMQSKIVLQDEAWLIDPILFNSFYTPTPYPNNAYPIRALKNLQHHSYKYFSNIAKWKDFCRAFKICIGGRVHGSLVALSSGCYPVIINDDMRSHEMMKLLDIIPLTRAEFQRSMTNISKNEFYSLVASQVISYNHISSQQALYKKFRRLVQRTLNKDISGIISKKIRCPIVDNLYYTASQYNDSYDQRFADFLLDRLDIIDQEWKSYLF